MTKFRARESKTIGSEIGTSILVLWNLRFRKNMILLVMFGIFFEHLNLNTICYHHMASQCRQDDDSLFNNILGQTFCANNRS